MIACSDNHYISQVAMTCACEVPSVSCVNHSTRIQKKRSEQSRSYQSHVRCNFQLDGFPTPSSTSFRHPRSTIHIPSTHHPTIENHASSERKNIKAETCSLLQTLASPIPHAIFFHPSPRRSNELPPMSWQTVTPSIPRTPPGVSDLKVCAKTYDILADKMMGIEGVLIKQAWEAKVMSDLIIVFADLVGPGEEESWAELENRRIDGYERLLQSEMEEVEAMQVEIINEELSRYCDSCSTLCKSKLEENLKNKFFDLVLVTFGPHAFFFGLDTTSLTLYR
ncbi:MAG: hypothetical protein BYD32DRAFT_474625 [Podila humilis]|nr:MAG: hypothetical protein BYD32DRAFT_474625 [Podila humilis]